MNPVLATEVTDTLVAYEARYGAPSGRVDVLRAALDAGRSVTSRDDVPIHVTCGGIVRDPDGRVLQVHHKVLGIWLFPGGHLEPRDASLLAAARREVAEETGLVPREGDVTEARRVPVDIGVHLIPANDGRGEPEHYHADFRYIVPVTGGTVQLQPDEVTDWRWVDPDHIGNPRLAERLRSR